MSCLDLLPYIFLDDIQDRNDSESLHMQLNRISNVS